MRNDKYLFLPPQVPALLRHLDIDLDLLHRDLDPGDPGVHPQQVRLRPRALASDWSHQTGGGCSLAENQTI